MDFEIEMSFDDKGVQNSTNMDVVVGNDKEMAGCSSVGEVIRPGKDDEMTQNSSERKKPVVPGDEPYVGQEFESEAEALAFYSEYGMRVGFITRVSKLCRSRLDKSIISRAIVCNKEGYRMPDKRDRKDIKPRKPTRVGCRAMIVIKKLSPRRWAVTRFVKEHTHALTPGKGRKGFVYNQFPAEHDKIQDLNQQLLLERERCLAYKRYLDLIFKHVEEYTDNMSQKVQYIVDCVREIESESQEHQQNHR